MYRLRGAAVGEFGRTVGGPHIVLGTLLVSGSYRTPDPMSTTRDLVGNLLVGGWRCLAGNQFFAHIHDATRSREEVAERDNLATREHDVL